MQWGGPGNGGEDVAVQAGIWGSFAYVSVFPLRERSSIAYDGAGNQPEDWCVDGSPTLGAGNDGCSVSRARSPVIISEVGHTRTGPNTYHPTVEVKNVGSVLEK